MQQKIGERYRWGATSLSLAKMQGQGSKKIGERYRWGATPHLWEKCRGKAVQQKLASATAGGLPSIFGKNAGAGQCSEKLERDFGKMQGQGSAVKNWRALLGGLPLYLAGAGQCSKTLASATAGGRPLYLWEKHGSPNPYENPIG